jgi:hypothetical protein
MTPMKSDSRVGAAGKATLEELMRERIRATIEILDDEELEAALGAAPSQRVGAVRTGYRQGTGNFVNPGWPTLII